MALKASTRCLLWGLGGGLVIAVLLPSLLVCFSCGRSGPISPFLIKSYEPIPWDELFISWVRLLVLAFAGCGFGAVLLSLVVFGNCEQQARNHTSLIRTVLYGAALGAFFAFFNLPGYVVIDVLRYQSHLLLKVVLLFSVTGATSGAWIAWQAWRAAHSVEKLWPRFSLGVLMISVIAWGTLLAVFAPE